jgi:cytochrome c-type biogenesis protein CcmH/NrfG
VSGAAKRVVASVVALAAILVLAGGLRAMQVRQQREADDARTRPADSAAAAIQSAPAWPAVTPIASAADTASPDTIAAPAPTDTGSAAAPGGAVDVGDTSAHPSVDVPPLPPVIARETPIEGHDAPGASIVSQANHALRRGATERALALARQAVAANPSDADAWLILGAACQSAGDSAGAHDAYNNCLQRAHTANISECRLLARH